MSILCIPDPSPAAVDSYFVSGLSFFDTADLAHTASDLNTRSLSPAWDNDFLLSFGAGEGLAVLGGFGLLWSRRTERSDNIPFAPDQGRSRLQLLGFPFSAGVVKRFSPPDRRGWVAGGLAHYYFLQLTVENPNSAEGDPRYFRLAEDDKADRDGQGPGITAFAAYEIPFFLGRLGAGVKARWTSISIDPVDGMSTPDVDLSAITLFLSVALAD